MSVAFKREGYTVLGQMSQTILETAYNMRGIPRLMVDFYESPFYVAALFRRIAEQRTFRARRFAEAGQVHQLCDDRAVAGEPPHLFRGLLRAGQDESF